MDAVFEVAWGRKGVMRGKGCVGGVMGKVVVMGKKGWNGVRKEGDA